MVLTKILYKTSSLIFLLVGLIILSAIFVMPIKAQSSIITINADGTVTPSNVGIQASGNTYTVTADLNSSIVVLANNIVINGANHLLQGSDLTNIGLNLTAANDTVENFHITNWQYGILGVWNNNTITNNEFENNSQGITIYGDDYVVSQNTISNSSAALFIDGGFQQQGDNNLVIQNQISDNDAAFDITNCNGTTITENDISTNNVTVVLATNTANTIIYENNFTDNAAVLSIPFAGPGIGNYVPFSPAGQWDNGTVGNYWSDYLTKYPNATEIDHTGIGNTPYVINDTQPYTIGYPNGTTYNGIAVLGTATDRYPIFESPSIQNSPTPAATAMPTSSTSQQKPSASALQLRSAAFQTELIVVTAIITVIAIATVAVALRRKQLS